MVSKRWRVSDSNGKRKQDDYVKLKEGWREHIEKEDIVSFWIKTDPILTIPPYQDIKNRRPPKCYTLLINEGYLDERYPCWKEWVNILSDESTGKYQRKLGELKSQKGKILVASEEVKARTLKIILDANKNIDKYQLNGNLE